MNRLKNYKFLFIIIILSSIILGLSLYSTSTSTEQLICTSQIRERPSNVSIPSSGDEVEEVSRVIVSFKGDTSTAKGFTWYTSANSLNSTLEVVEQTKGSLLNFEHAIRFRGEQQKSTNAPEYVIHKVQAVGLKPDTKYRYRVGDASLNLWSEVGSFETSDVDGKFTFINLADSQAESEIEAVLSSETFAKANETVLDSEFMILNGDIVNNGLLEEQWGWVLDHSATTLLNTTFVSATGNHERALESFIEHFNLDIPEESDTKSGAYYSFNYENTHFIILNSNEDSKEYSNFTIKQIEWLKADVKEVKQDTNMEWIIAVMHKGPYTTSNHATDKDIINEENGVRYKMAPLFNQLGIDLVLQGHDHIYARTLPIKNGKVTQETKLYSNYNGKEVEYSVDPDGTIYMIPNTAGSKVYYKNKVLDSQYYDLFQVANEHSAAQYGADPNDTSSPLRGQIQNFVEFNIDENKLTGITYEINQRKDNGKPYIIDTFGIIKNEKAKNKEAKENIIYKVKKGDTLYRIGLRYGTTYQAIQILNNIVNPNKIYPNQLFIIKVGNKNDVD